MELDVGTLDEAREVWRSGRHAELERASISGLNLGAALEGACWAAGADQRVLQLLQRWSPSSHTFMHAHVALTTGRAPPRPGEHDAPEAELALCPSRSELVDPAVGVEWQYFLDRFGRSLTSRLQLPRRRALGIAGALREMVDNVVEHAGLGDAPLGVVAYEVSESTFGFAVADLGRGILSSLRGNPRHAGICTDVDALLSAVTGGASRRPGVGGTGFADLLRALADLDGYLTFRSGSGRLMLDGRGSGGRRHEISNSPNMLGFQLSVTAHPHKSTW